MRIVTLLRAVLVLGVVSMAWNPARSAEAQSAGNRPAVTVYKSPYCGCCEGWVDHMRAHGYPVTTFDMEDLQSVKTTARVPTALESCHTAVVDGYTIEGHVPADAVDRLLAERPAIQGLAVPGMPAGSPGMEGGDPQPYDVMSFDKAGSSAVFMSVDPKSE